MDADSDGLEEDFQDSEEMASETVEQKWDQPLPLGLRSQFKQGSHECQRGPISPMTCPFPAGNGWKPSIRLRISRQLPTSFRVATATGGLRRRHQLVVDGRIISNPWKSISLVTGSKYPSSSHPDLQTPPLPPPCLARSTATPSRYGKHNPRILMGEERGERCQRTTTIHSTRSSVTNPRAPPSRHTGDRPRAPPPFLSALSVSLSLGRCPSSPLLLLKSPFDVPFSTAPPVQHVYVIRT